VEENGLFKAYPDLEEYWKEDADKFPYELRKMKSILASF
jgi:hypothetical protein